MQPQDFTEESQERTSELFPGVLEVGYEPQCCSPVNSPMEPEMAHDYKAEPLESIDDRHRHRSLGSHRRCEARESSLCRTQKNAPIRSASPPPRGSAGQALCYGKRRRRACDCMPGQPTFAALAS